MKNNYDELVKKLEIEIQEVSWSALEDHYQRGAVLIVEPVLDLAEVAAKVALDDVESVRGWMKDDTLRKAKGDEIITYQNDNDIMLKFLIVQPYVLVQEFIDL